MQKPSERIAEIINHLDSTRNIDKSRSQEIGELLKKRYGTANYKIVAILQFLDEQAAKQDLASEYIKEE